MERWPTPDGAHSQAGSPGPARGIWRKIKNGDVLWIHGFMPSNCSDFALVPAHPFAQKDRANGWGTALKWMEQPGIARPGNGAHRETAQQKMKCPAEENSLGRARFFLTVFNLTNSKH
jgi:hypothetical protein